MNNIYFLDTETTGKDPTQAHVVEIAIIADDLKIENRCKPRTPISIGAMAVHHITDQMVADLPDFVATPAYDYLLDHPGDILVAHNAPYDVRVLGNEWIIISRYIDTLTVARHIMDDASIESYSLEYLRYYHQLDMLHEWELSSGFAHSALYDTIVLSWLYQLLRDSVMQIYPDIDPVVKMLELTCTPVLLKRLAFGKYKGCKYEEIRAKHYDYLMWLEDAELKKPMHEQNKDMLYTLTYWKTRKPQ